MWSPATVSVLLSHWSTSLQILSSDWWSLTIMAVLLWHEGWTCLYELYVHGIGELEPTLSAPPPHQSLSKQIKIIFHNSINKSGNLPAYTQQTNASLLRLVQSIFSYSPGKNNCNSGWVALWCAGAHQDKNLQE